MTQRQLVFEEVTLRKVVENICGMNFDAILLRHLCACEREEKLFGQILLRLVLFYSAPGIN